MIGALLGGVLFGVVGAIVGGVLVPLITYIAQEVIEGTINAVAQRITDALNSIAPTVEVPAVGFNLIFSNAFIDDVFIACNVQPIDTAPVRATGTIVLRNGTAVDLDSGRPVRWICRSRPGSGRRRTRPADGGRMRRTPGAHRAEVARRLGPLGPVRLQL